VKAFARAIKNEHAVNDPLRLSERLRIVVPG
jgi:hypothetical protein